MNFLKTGWEIFEEAVADIKETDNKKIQAEIRFTKAINGWLKGKVVMEQAAGRPRKPTNNRSSKGSSKNSFDAIRLKNNLTSFSSDLLPDSAQ